MDRLRTAVAPSEAQRVERVLASARIFFAVGSLLAIYFDPTEPSSYAGLTHVLLIVYVVHSLLVFALVRIRQESTWAFRFSVHSVDVLWTAVIALFTEGPNSPFYLFFVFVLLAAAYRWGFQETLATTAASIVLLFVQALLVSSGSVEVRSILRTELELNRLIMRSLYLLIAGYLLGYLGEEEKELRAETSVISRVIAKAQKGMGLSGTLQAVLNEILKLFGSARGVLAVREAATSRVFLWDARRAAATQETAMKLSELDSALRERYFFDAPGDCWLGVRKLGHFHGEGYAVLALNEEGERLLGASVTFPRDFIAAHVFASLVAVTIQFGEEWSGRLILFDPRVGLVREPEVRFLQNLVREVSPAVYNVYLLRRLRTRAGAVERARVARELHDGVIQSLIGVEMQVDVLRRQAAGEPQRVAAELERIQQLLRDEVLNLRELMQQMKPLDLGPKQLLDYLAESVDKFRRDTGIAARFTTEFEELALAPRVCREVGRILQEALVNVRKHSGARNVLVRFASQDGNWKLVIDDDGKGFDFDGRLGHKELDASRKGPVVIKERVRSIAGELSVESAPGRGARLEIVIPQKTYG